MTERPHWASIVAINGSHRTNGLTARVLERLAQSAATRGVRLDVIHLAEYTIKTCGICGDCNVRPNPCEVEDDVPELVERIQNYEGVIYATPVYGFGLSSRMQAFIERAGVGYLRFERPLANKVAGVIVTGRRYSHGRVHGQLVDNVLLNRMILPGSGFPALVHGQLGGEPESDGEGMASAVLTLDRMIDLLGVLLLPHSGRDEVERRLSALPRNERVAVQEAAGERDDRALPALNAGSRHGH